MELIDKEIFADSLCEECTHAFAGNITVAECRKHKCVIMNKINEAKSVDAVPIIRCKDCKWWGNAMNWDGHTVGGCDFVEMVTDADGYCYRAKRKEVQE